MENICSKVVTKVNRPVKFLQFGEGNFLRGFVDWFIDTMNKKTSFNAGVVVVQPMPFGRCDKIKEADCLYTLILQGKNNGNVVKTYQVIDCIEDAINPYTQYEEYLNYAKLDSLEFIVSNTTEAGIVFEPKDTDFTKCPFSFPAKLLVFLETRYNYYNGDFTKGLEIIPCELIDNNGDTLKETLIRLANHMNKDNSFIDWLSNANRYYNTLVDRIVPGYPAKDAQRIWNELGYVDNNIVVGEYFHLWCIDGKYINKLEEKLPVKEAGLNVLFVDSTKPYKERKVKVLNGAHTCMVPIAYLSGINSVKDAVEDELIGRFVKDFMFEEVIPTIDISQDEMISYCNSVFERYENPFVDHLLMSIALNSMTKYKTRVLPTVLENLKNNKLPKRALFALASLIVFYRGKRDDEIIELSDDKWILDMYNDIWSTYDGTYQGILLIISKVLGLEIHWGVNLLEYNNVVKFVCDAVYEIMTTSIKNALIRLVFGEKSNE